MPQFCLDLRTRRKWIKTLPGSFGLTAVDRLVSPTFLKASLKFRSIEGRLRMKVLLVGSPTLIGVWGVNFLHEGIARAPWQKQKICPSLFPMWYPLVVVLCLIVLYASPHLVCPIVACCSCSRRLGLFSCRCFATGSVLAPLADVFAVWMVLLLVRMLCRRCCRGCCRGGCAAIDVCLSWRSPSLVVLRATYP